MSDNLRYNDLLLNFTYLTSIFYNFIVISGKNFKKVNLNQIEQNINSEFEKLNQDNFLDYLDYKSFLQRNDEEAKKYKLKFIKTAFNLDYNQIENEKLFSELSQKMTISMFSEKNKLIKLLSLQSIDFVYEIYDYFYLIFKNMEECQKKKIQNLIADSLLEEEKTNQGNSKLEKRLLNENKELKDKIDSMKDSIKQNKNNVENLDKENQAFKKKIIEIEKKEKIKECEIIKLKQHIKEMEKTKDQEINLLKENIKKLEKAEAKKNEEIEILKEDIKKVDSNENEINQLKLNMEKIINDKIKESNTLLIKELEDKKEKLIQAEDNYSYMKDLNMQIIKDQSFDKEKYYEKKICDILEENNKLKKQLSILENTFEIEISIKNREINGLTKITNILSEDLEVVNNKLLEQKEELDRLNKK